jgi:hypothetical protein
VPKPATPAVVSLADFDIQVVGLKALRCSRDTAAGISYPRSPCSRPRFDRDSHLCLGRLNGIDPEAYLRYGALLAAINPRLGVFQLTFKVNKVEGV